MSDKKRKYLPTVAELIDRLSIIQLKEVFITEHKDEYAKEIEDIVHDLNLVLNWEKPTGEMIRAIVVLAQNAGSQQTDIDNSGVWSNFSGCLLA